MAIPALPLESLPAFPLPFAPPMGCESGRFALPPSPLPLLGCGVRRRRVEASSSSSKSGDPPAAR
eukprot:8596685-Alexandrium_andersonii.AAC.1